MKWMFILILIPYIVDAQTVNESLIDLRKSYAPLLGTESAVLSIDIVRNYDLGGGDTTLYAMIQVIQRTSDVTGYSLGFALFSSAFGAGSSVGTNLSIQYNDDSGTAILSKTEFDKLYDAVNKTYQYITTLRRVKSSDRESVVTFNPNQFMTFAGEYAPSALTNKERFYIKVGAATFSLNIQEFEEVARSMREFWNNF